MSLNDAQKAAADAKRLLQPFQQELLTLTEELVRANSVAVPPRGNETPAQEVLQTFLKTHGLQPELYDVGFITSNAHPYVRQDRDYRGRRNLSIRITGAGRGKSLLFNGHVDTVPPGRTPWTSDPWSPRRDSGRLYGLGTFDMKAGVAAQACAIAALRRSGVSLAGDLLLQSVVDEEWGGGGGTLAALLRGDRADAAVICEGTQLDILRATRGGFVVDLIVEAGDPSLYFSEGPVLSPALPLARLLGWVETWTTARAQVKAQGAYASVADPAPVQVLAVEANRLESEVPLSVPLRAAVRVYFQFLPSEDVTQVLSAVRQSLDDFQQNDAFFSHYRIAWKPLYDPPLLGHELSGQHAWTECMHAAVSSVRGTEARVSAAPYPCDAFLLHREFKIPTLLFGPCGGGAHNPDEYVEINSVLTTTESLLSAALLWCG